MIVNQIFPVILCGGSGTRLWPLSRESFPKQFLSLLSRNNDTLLQVTQKRLSGLDNLLPPIIICNEDHRFIVAEQMREIGTKPFSIILEPFGKDTCPAIALAALTALEKKNDPFLIVLSSDHEIKNKSKFLESLNVGLEYSKKGKLVNFGVLPKSPETGYGYIKSEKILSLETLKGEDIVGFVEKPNLENAQKFLNNKQYSWNSGIFLFKAKAILDEINKFKPEIISFCKKALEKSTLDLDFQRLDKTSFGNCPKISVDKAVMEKTKRGTVVPLDAGWSDIGSWQAVWENSPKDKNGNFVKGKVFLEKSTNCYMRSESSLLVGVGLENLVAIETNDAVLVANKFNSQEIKNIVKKLKENEITEGQSHLKIFRPWGYYLTLIQESNWRVKLINVKSGEKLSLQKHSYRSEHWVVVSGQAKVELNDRKLILEENEGIFIPIGSKHRLINEKDIPLFLIEVQCGSYLGEDDIIRFEDKYGR